MSGIALRDLRTRVKDEMSGVDGNLWLKSFTAGHLAEGVEAPIELDAQFDFAQPAVKGELSGDTALTLKLGDGSAALRDTNLTFKGDAPGANGIEANLRGSVAWNGASKSVEARQLAVSLKGRTGPLVHDGSRIEIDRFAFDPAAKALDLRKLHAQVKGSEADQPLTLELDWPELAVHGESLSGSAFSGKLTRGGEMPVDASFKSGAPSGSFETVALPGFQAQITSRGPQRAMDGTLSADLSIKPTPGSLALQRLALKGKVQEAGGPALALGIQGQAVLSAERSSWNLSGQLNTNRFSTDGTAIFAGVTPQIRPRRISTRWTSISCSARRARRLRSRRRLRRPMRRWT